jgi:hypothetical protein
LVEDVFIDIYMASILDDRGTIGQYIQRHGLRGLFREKAKFFRKHRAESWISEISNTAGYAMLSSLTNCQSDAISERAECAISTWNRFEEYISGAKLKRRNGVKAIEEKLDDGKKRQVQIGRIAKIGGQLNLRKINAVVEKLPEGDYTLLVLRRSLAGKSPALRSSVRSIMGSGAKVNSFKFYSHSHYNEAKKSIAALVDQKYVLAIYISIESAEIKKVVLN